VCVSCVYMTSALDKRPDRIIYRPPPPTTDEVERKICRTPFYFFSSVKIIIPRRFSHVDLIFFFVFPCYTRDYLVARPITARNPSTRIQKHVAVSAAAASTESLWIGFFRTTGIIFSFCPSPFPPTIRHTRKPCFIFSAGCDYTTATTTIMIIL